jgi:hypothetical protein
MNTIKITLIVILVAASVAILAAVTIQAPTMVLSATQTQSIEFGCTPDFWKNNLELWETVGVNYNDDFDETFVSDYFEPDITLKQAINAEGLGLNHLARSGTAAYLSALADPEIDEIAVRDKVHFGYVHEIDKYLEYCASQTGETQDTGL